MSREHTVQKASRHYIKQSPNTLKRVWDGEKSRDGKELVSGKLVLSFMYADDATIIRL